MMPSLTSTSSSPTSTTSSDHGLPRRKPRVSAEHTLNRVRENQRRHRARQKDYIASLELNLAETERQLAKARAEIDALKQERDTANAFACYDISKHFFLSEGQVDSGITAMLSADSPPGSPSDSLTAIPAPSNIVSPAVFETSLQLPPASTSSSGPPPCCTDALPTTLLTLPSAATTIPVIEPSDPQCSSCKTRPLPSPFESTTLCAQAFVMISQRNARNLDPELIRLWLSQGYRRAIQEGEGCRVENGTLGGLLDYISGV